MKPCPKQYDPRPQYIAALIGDVAQRKRIADASGILERNLRNYCRGTRIISYGNQYLIEQAVGVAAVRRARAKAGAR